MEVTNDSLEWDSEDMVQWRAFLKTRAGQRLIPKLLENIPGLLPGGDTNAILIRNGEVRGWTESGRALLALQFPAPEVMQAEAYPPLTDDSKWDDGKKLTEP